MKAPQLSYDWGVRDEAPLLYVSLVLHRRAFLALRDRPRTPPCFSSHLRFHLSPLSFGLNTCLHSVLTNLLAASQIFIFPAAALRFTACKGNSASPFRALSVTSPIMKAHSHTLLSTPCPLCDPAHLTRARFTLWILSERNKKQTVLLTNPTCHSQRSPSSANLKVSSLYGVV